MTQHKMPLLDQIVNLFAVVIPFLATIAAIVLFWNQIVTPLDLALFLGMYMLTTFGITIGFHRLLTHRSFQTFKPIEYFLAIAGSMAVEGPVNTWVADHRKHHAHTDEEGDPRARLERCAQSPAQRQDDERLGGQRRLHERHSHKPRAHRVWRPLWQQRHVPRHRRDADHARATGAASQASRWTPQKTAAQAGTDFIAALAIAGQPAALGALAASQAAS